MKHRSDRGTRDQKALVLARRYATDLTALDRRRLHVWAQALLAIRNSNLSVVQKARAALRATARRQIARPLAVQLARRTRELGISSRRQLWDERGWGARLGLLGVSMTMVASAGQGAGIAALGTAIGVPLWLVVGAGGTFLGALVEELATAGIPFALGGLISSARVNHRGARPLGVARARATLAYNLHWLRPQKDWSQEKLGREAGLAPHVHRRRGAP